MYCCDSPWLFAILRLCFAKYTFFFNEYFIPNLVIIVDTSIILALIATISQWLLVLSNLDASQPQTEWWWACLIRNYTWWGFKYCMISRANCPCCIVKKDIKVIGVTDLAISISAVCSICPRTWCKHYYIAFTYTVWLAEVFKVQFNSLALSYIKWQHRGYLHNQV